MFRNRKVLIVTMHGKENVIAPLLEKNLGLQCIVSEDFDTDLLGTFSGEVERMDDPLVTVRKKCELALANSDCDLAVASEGSFGPHPTLFFVPADEELVMFYDPRNELEIVAHELSTDTNFAGEEIHSEEELKDFAVRVLFPSHGLILKTSKSSFIPIKKGITDWQKLIDTYRLFSKTYGSVYAETDMRAMHNPTRMHVIEKATQHLVEKINSRCPSCAAPGYGVTGVKYGLPCRCCGTPTRSTLSYIRCCIKCGHTTEEHFPHSKTHEDPMYCDVCNP